MGVRSFCWALKDPRSSGHTKQKTTKNNKKLDFCSLLLRAPLEAQMVKRLPRWWETWVGSLGQEDPLEKEMATHSSTLAWKIPWMEESGRLQSIGPPRVGHNWVTSFSFFCSQTRIIILVCFERSVGLAPFSQNESGLRDNSLSDSTADTKSTPGPQGLSPATCSLCNHE